MNKPEEQCSMFGHQWLKTDVFAEFGEGPEPILFSLCARCKVVGLPDYDIERQS